MRIDQEPSTQNPLVIRQALPADIDQIIRLQRNDGFAHAKYLTAERMEGLIGKDVFYVAHFDNQAVGMTSVANDGRKAQLHFLSVDTKFQRRGIGTALVTEVKKNAMNTRAELLYTAVESQADDMHTFLRNQGFYYAGNHVNRFGKGEHAIFWNFNTAPHIKVFPETHS